MFSYHCIQISMFCFIVDFLLSTKVMEKMCLSYRWWQYELKECGLRSRKARFWDIMFLFLFLFFGGGHLHFYFQKYLHNLRSFCDLKFWTKIQPKLIIENMTVKISNLNISWLLLIHILANRNVTHEILTMNYCCIGWDRPS